MKNSLLFDFQVNKEKNQILVSREFAAEKELVWLAWTTPELIDLWWAPKPYFTKTKTMDFRNGGTWLYAMCGPNEEVHWCRADYEQIVQHESFAALDAFCNEEGEINTDFPRSHWTNQFVSMGNTTRVDIVIQYNSLDELQQIVEFGFKEGFTAALENLDQYFSAQLLLQKKFKKSNAARTSFYVNFPGNTEEVFEFYRSVFRTEFNGGIHRFGDIPVGEGQPPVAEELKKMILHVELPLLGNTILMGTDAPKEMGFTLTPGNNMHIQLEPDSREEATRLFNELSVGGKIEMPIADAFWGAYFGSFTDRYGINWMINYTNV